MGTGGDAGAMEIHMVIHANWKPPMVTPAPWALYSPGRCLGLQKLKKKLMKLSIHFDIKDPNEDVENFRML